MGTDKTTWRKDKACDYTLKWSALVLIQEGDGGPYCWDVEDNAVIPIGGELGNINEHHSSI